MRDTEERIIEEAKAQVRKRLAHEEANWLATRLGLACLEYPLYIRDMLRVAFQPILDAIYEELKAVRAENAELKVALDKARQAFRQLLEERARMNGHQPQRR